MDIEFIEGFIEKCAEYGITDKETITAILKEALVLPRRVAIRKEKRKGIRRRWKTMAENRRVKKRQKDRTEKAKAEGETPAQLKARKKMDKKERGVGRATGARRFSSEQKAKDEITKAKKNIEKGQWRRANFRLSRARKGLSAQISKARAGGAKGEAIEGLQKLRLDARKLMRGDKLPPILKGKGARKAVKDDVAKKDKVYTAETEAHKINVQKNKAKAKSELTASQTVEEGKIKARNAVREAKAKAKAKAKVKPKAKSVDTTSPQPARAREKRKADKHRANLQAKGRRQGKSRYKKKKKREAEVAKKRAPVQLKKRQEDKLYEDFLNRGA